MDVKPVRSQQYLSPLFYLSTSPFQLSLGMRRVRHKVGRRNREIGLMRTMKQSKLTRKRIFELKSFPIFFQIESVRYTSEYQFESASSIG